MQFILPGWSAFRNHCTSHDNPAYKDYFIIISYISNCFTGCIFAFDQFISKTYQAAGLVLICVLRLFYLSACISVNELAEYLLPEYTSGLLPTTGDFLDPGMSR